MDQTFISPRFLQSIPRDFAREHLVIGAGTADTVTRILHADKTDPLVVHNVRVALGGHSIEAECVAGEQIARLIDEAYSSSDRAAASAPSGRADREGIPVIELSGAAPDFADAHDLDEDLKRLAASGDQDLLNLGGKGPVIRLVDGVLFDAIGQGASDIHIQPLAGETLIRFRLDGVLLTARRVPARLAPAVVSRIKIMARLDIAERRAPQDGRATVTIGRGTGARAIDLRIATIPSAYGERVVIRLLDTQRGGALASLDAIGMPANLAEQYQERATRSSGIVLLTGPTGSGKTTTLYATLRAIAQRSHSGNGDGDVNVMTIEDPIEYDLSSIGASEEGGRGLPISQTQVDLKKGLTFASGLRHILRQDPDVIMVGEIRDTDTARIAIQASLTGHLVFSTLHTADAPGAVTRLIDLGIEPYLVASSLSCVLAQRLVRLLHTARPDGTGCNGRGCADCLQSGFKGRRGIFELLVIDPAIRELIATGATATAIRDAALTRGMVRLDQHGLELVTQGATTQAEVRRVTLGAE